MSQVGRMIAPGFGSANCVAAGATIHKQFVSGVIFGHRCHRSRFTLSVLPSVEIMSIFRNNFETHMGMSSTAILSALTSVCAGHIRLDPFLIYEAGNHLGFSRECRHPKAVNDVGTFQLDEY